jgi:hypothetical protein
MLWFLRGLAERLAASPAVRGNREASMERGEMRGKHGQQGSFSRPSKRSGWDRKTDFCKNEPEKLLKTKDRHLKMGQNEPENEAEKCFEIGAC